MVKVTFFKNGFDVSGHALFDEHGKDIVCASVSGIVLGSLNWFDKKDISKCNINSSSANISFRLKKMSIENTIALDLIKTQLMSIQKNYKEFLEVIFFDSKIE